MKFLVCSSCNHDSVYLFKAQRIPSKYEFDKFIQTNYPFEWNDGNDVGIEKEFDSDEIDEIHLENLIEETKKDNEKKDSVYEKNRLLLKRDLFEYFAYKIAKISQTVNPSKYLNFHFTQLERLLFLVAQNVSEKDSPSLFDLFDKFAIYTTGPIEKDILSFNEKLIIPIHDKFNLYHFPEVINKDAFSNIPDEYLNMVDGALNKFGIKRIQKILKKGFTWLNDMTLRIYPCCIAKEVVEMTEESYFLSKEEILEKKTDLSFLDNEQQKNI
jgi:hypothetical protein